MHKPISLLFVLILSACAAGNKAVKPPETTAAPAAPAARPEYQYKVFIPSPQWQVMTNVKLQEGFPPAKMVIRHKTGEAFDAMVIVMTSPSALGGPKEIAEASRAADEKQGAVVTDVVCTEETPPVRCQYRGVVTAKDGAVAAMIVFKSLPETSETVALSGFWKQSLDGPMSEDFEKIASSFSVTEK